MIDNEIQQRPEAPVQDGSSTIDLGIHLSRPQKVGNMWACIRCSQIKKNLYKGGFCKLCFRVVKKQEPTNEELISPHEYEIFERDVERQQQRFREQMPSPRISRPERRESVTLKPERRESVTLCVKCHSQLPVNQPGDLCKLCQLLDQKKKH
ncbi:MAG: hypothetical protein ACE5OZ_01035 [Candidatus Heimdallarchaeota archaeon]